jgi:DNA-binding MarR family transcriptional regulator
MPSRFYQKVISLSKTPPGLKRLQEAAAAEDKSLTPDVISSQSPDDNRLVSPDDDRSSSPDDNRSPTPDDNWSASTGPEMWTAEGAGGFFSKSRISRIRYAQDALTHREEKVYDVLWGGKTQTHEASRLAQIGSAELARKARVARRTVVRLIDRLLEKGYIRVEVQPVSNTATSTVYRVLSYGAILKAQREAGKLWVLKTGTGVFFARQHVPGVSRSSSPDDNRSPTPDVAMSPSPDVILTPHKERHKDLGREAGTSSSSPSSVVVEALRAIDPGTDDDGAAQLIEASRKACPGATDEEIAHFILLKGSSKGIQQPLAFLKTAVPKCLQGESLRQYRREVQQTREAQAQHDRLEREHWQQVLDNPGSDEQSRAWAREALGLSAIE